VPPPHQARQAAGQERGRCRTGSIETITYDNGKEFASHVEIATSLGSLSYFAKPYHSWEGGLNEHTNGLFRQYFPKGSDLSTVSDTDVQRVEDKVNSRPRKILGYRS
jgi:transposase, IS30 family